MNEYQRLRIEVDRGVATVWLARPEAANALDEQLWGELPECFAELDASPEVRAVVLAAEGRHFCAGIDLSLFSQLPAGPEDDRAHHSEHLRALILRLQAALSALEDCRKPVLAAVQGACVGAGLAMVCCADMRYCTDDAYFSVKEIELAIAADLGTLQRLPRLIAPGLARELAYTGRKMSGEEAIYCGFCNDQFTDADEMLAEVRRIAREIAHRSPLAVRSTKQILNHARDHSVEEGLRHVATWNAGMLSSDEVLKSFEARNRGESPAYEG